MYDAARICLHGDENEVRRLLARQPPHAAAARTGYITARDGMPLQVTFEVRGRHAIFKGDIIPGGPARSPRHPKKPVLHRRMD